MENQKNSSQPVSPNEKFPHWTWLYVLVGTADLFVYGFLLIGGLQPSYWRQTLENASALLLMVGAQGISFALAGVGIMAAAKPALIKKDFNFKRFVFFNAAGFLLLSVVLLIVFFPSHTGGDYAFGIALLPIFVYPFFNLIRFFILLAASILIVRFSRSS